MSKATLFRILVMLATLAAIWFVIAGPGGVKEY
jgi:hypothetical protein